MTRLADTSCCALDYTAVHVKRDGQWQVDSIREPSCRRANRSKGRSVAAARLAGGRVG